MKAIKLILILSFTALFSAYAQRRNGIQDYTSVAALQAETLTPQQNDKVFVKATKYLYTWDNTSTATHDGIGVIKQTNIATGRFLLVTTDLSLKANLASPALTGNPTAPTQTAGNNTTRLATTAFVQTAISGKENTIAAGTTGQYYRGDKTFQTLDKTAVGLPNVDNTSDANKPVSTAQQTALNGKENTITAGTTGQYYRGDKTFQTLDKTAVGLPNVDNTSDANKPVSTAQQTALNLKANIASPTFTGVPAAPTASAGTNTTQLATTAFVTGAGATLQAAIDGKTGFFTIAQVRAFTGGLVTANPRIYLTDAGKEGFWYYDNSDGSTADNTGTVVVTSSGARYKRDYQGSVFASWFKELSDAVGAARDRAAINRAVTFAMAQTVPPTVVINQGTWLIENNAIYLSVATGKTLRIKGESGTVIDFLCTGATETATASVFRNTDSWVYPGNSSTQFTGSISGSTLTVTAMIAGTVTVGQSIFNGSGNITQGTTIVQRITGTGGTGTYIVSKQQTVSSTTISTDAAFLGWSSRTISHGTIELDGITFYGGRNPANNGSATVFSRPLLFRQCEGVSVTNCTFISIPGSAMAIGVCNGGTISGNKSKGVFARNTNDDIGDFCTLYAYCEDMQITNNIAELTGTQSGRCGISVDTYSRNILVSNNTITGYERGIHIELCSNVLVSNNHVYKSPQGGVSSSNVFCKWVGNLFDNNELLYQATMSSVGVFFALSDDNCTYENNTILSYSNKTNSLYHSKFWGQNLLIKGNRFTNVLNPNNFTSSNSSVTLGTGSKTFTYLTNNNLVWIVGNRLRVYNSESAFMEGAITAVSASSVTINVDNVYNTGTFSQWFIRLCDSRVYTYGNNYNNQFLGNTFELADLYADNNTRLTVKGNTFRMSLVLAQNTTDCKFIENLSEPMIGESISKGFLLYGSTRPYVSKNTFVDCISNCINNGSVTNGTFEENTYLKNNANSTSASYFFSANETVTGVKKNSTTRHNVVRDYVNNETYYLGNGTQTATAY